MKKYFRFFFTILLIAAAVYLYFHNASTPLPTQKRTTQIPSTQTPPSPIPSATHSGDDNSEITEAFKSRRSDVQVRGIGTVLRVMNDDTRGSRHQRFILRLTTGQTVLVAHNIDLAPRIPGIRKGDVVEFYGEYEWNDRGGVLHWTHKDPRGRHPHGWLKHKGQKYD